MAFAQYERLLAKYPVRTKAALGAGLAVVGDYFAQCLSLPSSDAGAADGIGNDRVTDDVDNVPDANNVHEAIDVVRLCAFGAFGGAWTGPVNHHWMGFLERTCPAATYGRLRSTAGKLLLQHAVFNPVVYAPAFLVYWGWVERLPRTKGTRDGIEGGVGAKSESYSLSAAEAKLRAEWWPLMQNIWLCWIPVTAATFFFVPVRHQPVFMATVSLGWNTLLSLFANRHITHNETLD